jgi:outer membrane lipoprotein-sorting protein
MLRKVCPVAVVAVFASLSGMALADEATDKAIKELERQFAEVRSYTSQFESMTDMEVMPGHAHKMVMVGSAEWQRRDGKALLRSESKHTTTKTAGDESTTTTSIVKTISDGELLHVLTEEDGQKTVIKSSAAPLRAYHPEGYFEQFANFFDVRLAPDAQVNGDDCYVFEMRAKSVEGAPPAGRQVVYFQKKHGIQVKSEAFDANGKLVTSSLTKDLKVNVDISADRFKFEMPPDAQVTDTTAYQAQPTPEEPTDQEAADANAAETGAKSGEKKGEKKGPKLPKWPK